MKHFFSDSGNWKVVAEFLYPDGTVMSSEGEAEIMVDKGGIFNEVRVDSLEIVRHNTYKITRVSKLEMFAESLDPDLPRLTGALRVDRNMLFFKYEMAEGDVNGYQIIHRHDTVCYTYGALYRGDMLTNTWTATLNKVA